MTSINFKKKKIVLISPLLIKGGSERTVSMLSRAFTKQGHDVVVVTYSGPVEYPIAGKTIMLNIPTAVTVMKKVVTAIRRISALRRILREEQPDITVSFLSNIAPILTLRPLIVSVRSHYERMSFADKIALKTIYKLRNVKAIVVPSLGLGRSIKKHAGISSFVVIPNAVSTEEIVKYTAIKERSDRLPTIIAIGRLVPVKRFDMLLRAFSQSGIADKTELLIIGDGPERKKLETIAREYPAARVRFVGQVENVYTYLAQARCLALSSEMETFASVIIEALACGTPVVATDCDFGPREILRDGVDGILVPNGNTEAFSQALKNIVTDDALYMKLKANTKQRAQDFSVEKIMGEWNTLFASL